MRMPSLVVLLWLAVALSVLPEALRWWRSSRSVWQVRCAADTNAPPAGLLTAGAPSRTRDDADLAGTLEAEDAADLLRMDDDGSPQMTSEAAALAHRRAAAVRSAVNSGRGRSIVAAGRCPLIQAPRPHRSART
jgi:hypothetical protein